MNAPAKALKFYFYVLGIGLLASGCTATPEEEGSASLFSSLQQEAPLEIALETDLYRLLEGKESEERQTGRLLVRKDGVESSYNIEVRARGNMRRRYCSFPPLKLYFDEQELEAKGLSGSDDIKLVTHCQDSGEQWVLKEYLTYRLYNEISPRSFRVQLARIRYQDSQGRLPDETYYAFLIEPKSGLAARLGGELVEPADGLKAVQAEQYRQFVLFNYMVGNTDWSIGNGHNVELIRLEGEAFPSPIPYDFDNAGLVDADYAVPHPQLPIDDVSERLFQWRGKNLEGFDETIAHFRARETRLKAIVRECRQLSRAEQEKMARYLEEFFQLISQDLEETQWASALNQSNGWS